MRGGDACRFDGSEKIRVAKRSYRRTFYISLLVLLEPMFVFSFISISCSVMVGEVMSRNIL